MRAPVRVPQLRRHGAGAQEEQRGHWAERARAGQRGGGENVLPGMPRPLDRRHTHLPRMTSQ